MFEPLSGFNSFVSFSGFPPVFCIRKFFEMLPVWLQKFDIEILNEKKEVKIGKQLHPWETIGKRVPNYFDILLSGKSNKEYQSTVFHQLFHIYPRAGAQDMKLRVQQFLKNMDGVAMPVIMFG